MKQLSLPVCLLILAIGPSASAQPTGILGDWKSLAGSIVRVEHCGDQICMTLVQILNTDGGFVDSNNPVPSLHNRPLCGIHVGSGFTLTDPNHATGGTLYDPRAGRNYRGMLWVSGAKLHVRGYIGIPLFGESEVWSRPLDPVVECTTDSKEPEVRQP